MRILFIADVFGGPGRKVVGELLPDMIADRDVDFCILNAENAAGGFGLTPELAQEFYDFGADLITTGNHIWDRKEIYPYLDNKREILRPLNYPPSNPGRGAGIQGLKCLDPRFRGDDNIGIGFKKEPRK